MGQKVNGLYRATVDSGAEPLPPYTGESNIDFSFELNSVGDGEITIPFPFTITDWERVVVKVQPSLALTYSIDNPLSSTLLPYFVLTHIGGGTSQALIGPTYDLAEVKREWDAHLDDPFVLSKPTNYDPSGLNGIQLYTIASGSGVSYSIKGQIYISLEVVS